MRNIIEIISNQQAWVFCWQIVLLRIRLQMDKHALLIRISVLYDVHHGWSIGLIIHLKNVVQGGYIFIYDQYNQILMNCKTGLSRGRGFFATTANKSATCRSGYFQDDIQSDFKGTKIICLSGKGANPATTKSRRVRML